jgi:hypothetical protein
MSKATFAAVGKETVKGDAIRQLAAAAQGAHELNVLVMEDDVVDRETITIGDKSFEIVSIATDSTLNTTAFDNTSATVTETATAHGFTVGQVLGVESEFVQVTAVPSADTFTVSRGFAGSTIASHADGSAINTKDTPALTAGKILLPVGGTLTIAAAGPQIAKGLNALLGGGWTVEPYAAGSIVLHREADGVRVACSETMTDSSWVAANTFGGVETGNLVAARASRVPVTAEVTAGEMKFAFGFTPKFVRVSVLVTSSLAVKEWNGAYSVSGGVVTVDNSGNADWATTDTVTVEVFG